MILSEKLFDTTNHEYPIEKIRINSEQTLKWNNTLGIGFLNPNPKDIDVYDKDYWDNYRALIDTDIGIKLTKARIDIANEFKVEPLRLLDVGVGNAQFVDTFGCYGFDINPVAVEYLKNNKKYYDIINENFKWQWISMFDVIEHIIDGTDILSKCDNIILSTPIYDNLYQCLNSKHFKPNEHLWYFTVSGMIHYMNEFGFDCKYYSTIESKIGRDKIGSFVFKKYKNTN